MNKVSCLFPWVWGLSILLGGGTTDISKALWLLLAGGLLWVAPPRSGPGRGMEWVLGLCMLVICLGFLPREWLPDFAQAGLMADWFPEMVPLLAVRPWIALEEWFILLCGLSWFYLLLNTRGQNGGAAAMVHACWVFSLLAVILIVGNRLGLSYPTGEGTLFFSFFPNKNQTSTLFVIGTLLCGGYFLHSLGRSPWQMGLALAALTLNFSALVLAYSRAGLFLGVLGLLLLLAIHFRRASKWIPFSLGILLLGVVLVLSATVYSNFTLGEPVASRTAYSWAELRPSIYVDTITMVAEESPVGVGLGGFSGVFPQYREYSTVYQTVIHPESDWLWVVAETGWIGGLLLIWLVMLLAMKLKRRGIFKEHWLIAPCLVALAMVLVHSLVDVPLHRLSLWIISCWLLVWIWPRFEAQPTAIPFWMWRVGGSLFLILGILALIPYAGGPALLPKAKLARAEKRLQEAYLAGDVRTAERQAEVAMCLEPLDWRLHTLLAKVKLEWEGDLRSAQDLFHRARVLEPVSAVPPYEEGVAWVRYRPDLAVAAFRESVLRSIVNPTDLYRLILEKRIPQRNAFSPYMDDLTRTVPEFRYYYLSGLRGQAFAEAFARDWNSGYFTKRLDAAQQKTLVFRWFSDPYTTGVHLEGYESLSWFGEAPLGPILLLYYQGKHEEAVRALLGWIPSPSWPESSHLRDRETRQLDAVFVLNSDPVIGLELLRRAFEEEDWNQAATILAALQKVNPTPKGLNYWAARLALGQGHWTEAWSRGLGFLSGWPE